MTAPVYRVLHGTFVVVGYAPDGHTIRFIPDRPSLLDSLSGLMRLRVAEDRSVMLRLEGIDAPELHWSQESQPLATAARDTLLRELGFVELTYSDCWVSHHANGEVRGAIATRGIDARGRVIAYAFPRGLGDRKQDSMTISAHVAATSANAAMLSQGMAYPLAYDTQPAEHRAAFRAIAQQARTARRGVWAVDETARFWLESERSLGEHGQLVFPKLFRRCVAFLDDRERGWEGGISQWLETEAHGDNDVVLVGRTLRRLSELVVERGAVVETRVDPTEAVFVAR